ncbi:exonuclease SbcC [Methanolinea mesophila]|uniref:AAA family ATPase n=1 Tax=Methanolinea mesophila TaxID=547055 RepID=UPI001AEB9056|nr:AAA family ATPase [Methanolinea mesophila]MBP1929475.1 exonuclease SbcC [Methanolinea mesophila]
MIIDRIVLKNFKRFRDQEIRFRDGITGILGNNGTGKSSIVEAIFFALYGVQATGISSEYIVSSFASPKDRCEVRVDFRIGGDEYTILRTFKKGKTVQHDAQFNKGQKLLAKGVSDVEIQVRRVLGMGPVDFRNTVYAAQKDLLTLLENTPGKRKEWFLKALGIDYLKTESDRLLKERTDAKDRDLNLLEGELQGLIARHDPEELKALEDSKMVLCTALQELGLRVEHQKEKRKQVAAELLQFSDKKTEYTRLVERKTALAAEAQGLVRQRDLLALQLEGLPALEEEYQRLGRSLAALEGKKNALEKLRITKSDFEHLKSEQRFAEKEFSTLKTQEEKTRAKIELLERDSVRLASLRKGVRDLLHIGQGIPDPDLEQAALAREGEIVHSLGSLTARLEHLVDERKKLVSDWKIIEDAGSDGVCPLCRQTLGAHFGEIEEEFSSRLDWIEQEAMRVNDEKDRMIAERDRIHQQKPAFQEIRNISERLKNRESLEADLHDLLTQIREKEEVKKSLSARLLKTGYDEAMYQQTVKDILELEKVQVRHTEVGRTIAHGTAQKTQLAELGTRIVAKQDEIGKLELMIVQSEFDPEIGRGLERVLEEIDSNLRAAGAEIAANEERVRGNEEKITRHKQDKATIEGLKSQKTGLEEEIGMLRLTRSMIGEYVLYLMQVVRSHIEGEVSRIIDEITGGRYEQVLLDEDFNLLVRDIDNDYPIDRFSGGEQDDIAVALRIALSRYLAELHQVHESTLLIFDEIFGSQDEERRTNLLTALRTQESRFPQIILISHIPDIQGEFSNTLMVEMGTDLSSRVQEVT